MVTYWSSIVGAIIVIPRVVSIFLLYYGSIPEFKSLPTPIIVSSFMSVREDAAKRSFWSTLYKLSLLLAALPDYFLIGKGFGM